jgi:hypothetical protein
VSRCGEAIRVGPVGKEFIYDLVMAKSLAGVLAISIAALLFSGCGSGGMSRSESIKQYDVITDDDQACGVYKFLKSNPTKAQADARIAEWGKSLMSQGDDLMRVDWPSDLRDVMNRLSVLYVRSGTALSSSAGKSTATIAEDLGAFVADHNALVTEIEAKFGRPSLVPLDENSSC